MDKKLEHILLKSFDAELTAKEQEAYNLACENDTEFIEEKQSINKMRELFREQDYHFSQNFITDTMDKIQQLELEKKDAFSTINLICAFRQVAISGVAAIILAVLFIYFSGGFFPLEEFFGIDSLSSEEVVAYSMFEQF